MVIASPFFVFWFLVCLRPSAFVLLLWLVARCCWLLIWLTLLAAWLVVCSMMSLSDFAGSALLALLPGSAPGCCLLVLQLIGFALPGMLFALDLGLNLTLGILVAIS